MVPPGEMQGMTPTSRIIYDAFDRGPGAAAQVDDIGGPAAVLALLKFADPSIEHIQGRVAVAFIPAPGVPHPRRQRSRGIPGLEHRAAARRTRAGPNAPGASRATAPGDRRDHANPACLVARRPLR